MFFELSKEVKQNFTCHYTFSNNFVLNTDEGWEVYKYGADTVILKGYSNKFNNETLSQCLLNQSIPEISGNFCAFIFSDNNIKILHDNNRGFPLWTSENCITNLVPCGEQIWADCYLTVNNNFEITKHWYEVYNITQKLEDNKIINSIHEDIMTSYEEFLTHNTKPLKIFLSGGMDTTTSWAYLDHFTKDYELVDYEYIKHTHFWKNNASDLRKFWGYTQIHLWEEDCVLVTGGNGDENFLRGPTTLAIALKKFGLTFKDVLEPDDYHYTYIMNKYNYIKNELDESYDDIEDVNDYILNRNVNDHQHWHIDKTITFTPFKDIRILSKILSGSKDFIIGQARTGEINRHLIRKLDPNKLYKISKQKNQNPLEAT